MEGDSTYEMDASFLDQIQLDHVDWFEFVENKNEIGGACKLLPKILPNDRRNNIFINRGIWRLMMFIRAQEF